MPDIGEMQQITLSKLDEITKQFRLPKEKTETRVITGWYPPIFNGGNK
jgi:hypothetical protein